MIQHGVYHNNIYANLYRGKIVSTSYVRDCSYNVIVSQKMQIYALHVDTIDILYTLDSASHYSAIQKLKP